MVTACMYASHSGVVSQLLSLLITIASSITLVTTIAITTSELYREMLVDLIFAFLEFSFHFKIA